MFAGVEGSQDYCLQYEGGSRLCARVLPLLQLLVLSTDKWVMMVRRLCVRED